MTTSTKRARVVLLAGQWFLIAGLIFFSLMTSTPLVDAHNQWKGYGWVLGLMTDAAFIMALQAESTLARFNIKAGGPWPAIFRWTTGVATVFLNTWHSISERDWVGVAIHLITPALVLILAEVGPVFMRHLVEAERGQAAGTSQDAPTADAVADPIDELAALRERRPAIPSADVLPAVQADAPVNAFLPSEADPQAVPQAKLSKQEAAHIIEMAWKNGVSIDDAARAATRHPVSVRRQYAKLDAEHAAQAAQKEVSA